MHELVRKPSSSGVLDLISAGRLLPRTLCASSPYLFNFQGVLFDYKWRIEHTYPRLLRTQYVGVSFRFVFQVIFMVPNRGFSRWAVGSFCFQSLIVILDSPFNPWSRVDKERNFPNGLQISSPVRCSPPIPMVWSVRSALAV